MYLLKSNGRRCVAQKGEDKQGASQRYGGRNPETPSPCTIMGGRLYDTLHAFCIGHVHMKIGSYGSHYLGVGCHIHA